MSNKIVLMINLITFNMVAMNSASQEQSDANKDLLIAASNNKFDLAIKALKGGARVDAQDEKGETALHYAMKNADAQMIQLLIDNKASIYKENNDNYMPLLCLKYDVKESTKITIVKSISKVVVAEVHNHEKMLKDGWGELKINFPHLDFNNYCYPQFYEKFVNGIIIAVRQRHFKILHSNMLKEVQTDFLMMNEKVFELIVEHSLDTVKLLSFYLQKELNRNPKLGLEISFNYYNLEFNGFDLGVSSMKKLCNIINKPEEYYSKIEERDAEYEKWKCFYACVMRIMSQSGNAAISKPITDEQFSLAYNSFSITRK